MKGWEVISWAWEVHVESPAQRLVLLAYAWRAGSKRLAWPGLEQLAKDTLLHVDTISAARRQLVEFGYLHDTGQRRGVNGRVHVYRLMVGDTPEKRAIDPVDSLRRSPGKPGDCPGSIPRKTGMNTPESRGIDTPENRVQNYEVEHVHEQFTEQAQSGEAPEQPEQVQSVDAWDTEEARARGDAVIAMAAKMLKVRA